MEQSTPLSEVLALGIRLVRELELESEVDTLGRWMAHHLAETILAVDRLHGAEREAAQARAVELILKLWERRHSLPGGAHPLKQFEEVIAVLRRLQYGAWPFRVGAKDDMVQLLAEAFDGLRFLVAHGVFLAADPDLLETATQEEPKFLSADETFVLEAIQGWVNFCNPGRVSVAPIIVVSNDDAAQQETETFDPAETSSLGSKENSQNLFVERLDELIETLNALKSAVSR